MWRDWKRGERPTIDKKTSRRATSATEESSGLWMPTDVSGADPLIILSPRSSHVSVDECRWGMTAGSSGPAIEGKSKLLTHKKGEQ